MHMVNNDGERMWCPISHEHRCGTWCPMLGYDRDRDFWFCCLCVNDNYGGQMMRKEEK